MPTQNISLDYDDVQTVKWSYDTLFFNNLNVEKIVLDTQTIWEIPRTSTITSSGGLFPVSLVRTGDRFLDGGAENGLYDERDVVEFDPIQFLTIYL